MKRLLPKQMGYLISKNLVLVANVASFLVALEFVFCKGEKVEQIEGTPVNERLKNFEVA